MDTMDDRTTTETRAEPEAEPEPETEPEADREFRGFLSGLRVTLPGVQVLLAFLLAMPLQSAFTGLTDLERVVWYVALTAAAVSSVLLIAPSVHQYVRAPEDGVARHHDGHVMTGVRLAIAGSGFLGVSLVAALFLATSIAFDRPLAIAAAAVLLLLAGWAWGWLPLVTFSSRARADRR